MTRSPASLPLARLAGEGICSWGDHIIQLTWKEHFGFVIDGDTMERKEAFPFQTHTGEGWGITSDDKHLIVSDGSPYLHFWDPVTKHEVRRVEVKDPQGHPLHRLNELEYHAGSVFANIWYDDRIAQIDAQTGQVLRFLDFSTLYPKHQRPHGSDCFNGIARDPASGLWYLTGKLWDKMYVVDISGL